MNPQAVRALQAQLGVPQTGTLDAGTVAAMNAAVGKAVASHPVASKYAGGSSPESIVSAYMTGDWSGVSDLTGRPFDRGQQEAAVAQAEKALAPAYRAMESYDRAGVEDDLRQEADSLGDFQRSEERGFRDDKNRLDQGAADNGVLFAGSRIQAQNDLRATYQDRDAIARRNAADRIASTARANQYAYGDAAAGKLSDRYRLPGQRSFDTSVAGGRVTQGGPASAYDTGAYRFQGTKPVAQKAAVQQRAASLLANRANKLSLSGYGTKF